MLRNIKLQLLALAMLPAILTALVLGGYLAQNRMKDIEEFAEARAQALINQLDIAAQHALNNNDLSMLQSISNASLEEKGLRSISIFDTDKNIIVHSGVRLNRFLQVASHLSDQPVNLNSHDLLIFIKPLYGYDDTVRPGWIVVAYQHDIFVVKRYEAWLLQNVMLLLLLIASAVAGSWLASRFLRDIDQLRNHIKHLQEGDTQTTPAMYSSKELQQLAGDIGDLSSSMNNDISELRHNIELATSDLRSSIESMEIQNIELKLMQKEALTASRIKSEFLANTSHEIRTPLNGIIGFTRILKRTSLNAQQADYLQTIEQSSQGLLAIINDILDFSKIEAGKLELEESLFDIQQCCEDVISLFAPSAYEKNLELILLIYQDVPQHLIGDAMRIRQVLSNLVSNAIKFTRQGNIVIRVALEQQDNFSATVSFSVSDSGIGMDSLQQKNLFNAFSQANSSISREYGGTGLGLAIVKKLLELMHGDISVSSEPDQGSSFRFTLPLRISDKNLPVNDQTLSGKSVLIIEAHALSGSAISHILEQWRVNTQLISHADEAESLLALYHFDTIIYCLPAKKTIAEFTAQAQLLHQQTGSPLLFMLPPGHEKCSIALQPYGITTYKPVIRPRLHKALSQLLGAQLPADNQNRYNKPHILAVDDQRTNLKLMSALLADMNTTLVTARDGAEAIRHCQTQQFDLILMDIQMPGIDGVQATEQIRQQGMNRQTPVIAVTAHALSDEKTRLLQAGMNDYIAKPVNEELLSAAITRWVNRQPVVDIAESLKLAHQKKDLAVDLFTDLTGLLPDNMLEIKKLYAENRYDELLDAVHKLHGICCYTGVPQLKEATKALEQALKTVKSLPEKMLLDQFIAAAEAVLQWQQQYHFEQIIHNTGLVQE